MNTNKKQTKILKKSEARVENYREQFLKISNSIKMIVQIIVQIICMHISQMHNHNANDAMTGNLWDINYLLLSSMSGELKLIAQLMRTISLRLKKLDIFPCL